jgi:hypothetical protein
MCQCNHFAYNATCSPGNTVTGYHVMTALLDFLYAKLLQVRVHPGLDFAL